MVEKRKTVYALGIAVACAFFASCGRDGVSVGFGVERETNPTEKAQAFVTLRDRYFVRTLQLNPVTSTYLGGDGYSAELSDANGRLRDYSEDSLSKEISFYRETRQALANIDRAQLPPNLVVDYNLMDTRR